MIEHAIMFVTSDVKTAECDVDIVHAGGSYSS